METQGLGIHWNARLSCSPWGLVLPLQSHSQHGLQSLCLGTGSEANTGQSCLPEHPGPSHLQEPTLQPMASGFKVKITRATERGPFQGSPAHCSPQEGPGTQRPISATCVPSIGYSASGSAGHLCLLPGGAQVGAWARTARSPVPTLEGSAQ